MAEKGGRYLGQIPESHPYADPFLPPIEALHPKRLYGMTNEEFMKTRPEGEEGFMLPGSDLLWIQKAPLPKEGVPMSYLDPETDHG